MHALVYLTLIVPCVLSSPMFDLTQARTLQTEVDQGVPIEQVFEHFTQVFNKKYEDKTEEDTRRLIFNETVNYIKHHNLLYANGTVSYNLAVNQFSDLTHNEFLTQYTGHMRERPIFSNGSTFLPPANLVLPSDVDWRTKGYVTKVKNQGQCGSCWAFSTTGSVEGQHYKKTGTLESLSEQQLVDCSKNNNGCHGGLMDLAFDYIRSVGGIMKESDYPYTARDGTCKYKRALVVAKVTGKTDVPRGSETGLQQAVASVGPVSVAIDASHRSFQSYSSGVYYEPGCSSTKLNHGVLVVGYGSSPSGYWMVKNSWGSSWGSQGYIKMARNRQNNCGIATQASYPMV